MAIENVQSDPTQGYTLDPAIFAKFERALSNMEDNIEGSAPTTGGEQKKIVTDSTGKAVKPVGVGGKNTAGTTESTEAILQALQDVVEQASIADEKYSTAYVSGTNQNLILTNAADTPTLMIPSDTAILSTGPTGKANPFLTPSFIVALIEVMAELIKVQQEQRMVETKLDIMSNKWQIDLAKRAASDIMESAKKEAMMHYLLAASAGVQLGMAVANGAMGAIMMKRAIGDYNKQTRRLDAEVKRLETPADARSDSGRVGTDEQIQSALSKLNEHKAAKWSTISNSFRMRMFTMETAKDATDATARMYENLVQGIMKVQKAEYDADLKLVEAYQETARKIGQDASASLKDIEDKVKSIAEAVSQMIDKLYSAFNYRIH